MKTIYGKLLFLVLLLPFCAMAQNKVDGIVLDNVSGQPIPGVNVKIEGSGSGTSTGFDGKFQLTNVKPTDMLNVSYMGYKTKRIVAGSQNTITVKLEEDSSQLKEVVVQVGYGSVKKKDATGNISVLGVKDFNKGPVVSADQMISGRVAGMQVIAAGGAPGDNAIIRIRQGSSLTANNDPLYVIDGVPVQSGGVDGGRSPLSTINQNNIESISILKDASATAIYGSRASNGVVIITTKKGKTGDIKVSYNGVFQVSQVNNKVDVLSTDQFKSFIDANGNAKQKSLIGASSTNWQDEIYRTAFGMDNNVSVSGGVDNVTYRASVGYANLSGVLLRDNLQRTTLQAGLVGNFLDNHLRVEVNNNTAGLVNNYSNRAAVAAAVSYDPTQSVKNADGTYFQWYDNATTITPNSNNNPLSLIEQQNNYGTSWRSIGNILLDYKLHFLPALKASANFGYDQNSGKAYGNNEADYKNGLKGSGFNNTYENNTTAFNKLMDLYLNYNSSVNAIDMKYDITAGYSYQNFYSNRTTFNYTYESNLSTNNPPVETNLNLQSFFTRGNFNIANKYLLTASYRYDGTSRFTPDNRWAGFPAVAVGWKVNEEGFLKNVESVSALKLTFSWGITGQQDIGVFYPSIPLYLVSNNTAQYPLGGSYYNTQRPQPYNSNLKWEETEAINAGIDFGFFKNRITGNVNVYQKKTNDLLLLTNNPPFFGFSDKDNYNIGSVTAKGLEIGANFTIVKNDNWAWDLGGNITFQNSEITKLTTTQDNTPGIDVGGITGGTGNTIQNLQVGYSPKSFLVYEQAYGANGKPLNGVFIDRNEDGVVDTKDKYLFHKPNADGFYGVNTSVSYKNWLVAANFRGSWGNFNYNNIDSSNGTYQNALPSNGNYLTNGVSNILESGFTKASNEQLHSDYYIQDASFVRLDNVSVGYTFNQKQNSTSLVQLTFGVQNVFVLTDYKGLDPEVSNPLDANQSVGIDNNIYPRPITFTLGLNVNF
jgi:TonB-linked SusC/RagA family outer membrane protein